MPRRPAVPVALLGLALALGPALAQATATAFPAPRPPSAAAAAPAAPDASAVQSWTQFGGGPLHLGTADVETAFTPTSVPGLHPVWRGRLGPSSSSSGAVVSGGVAYVAGGDAVLRAFRASGCGAEECAPLWRGRTRNTIAGTPVVAGGLVLVASADRYLHAFAADGCGASVCEPLWRGRLGAGTLGSPVVAGRTVYVGDFGGSISAFPLAGCGAQLCDPAWRAHAGPDEQLDAVPTVHGNHLFVGTTRSTPHLTSGRLLAFDLHACAAAGSCDPSWSASLRGPHHDAMAPVVAGGYVYAGSSTRFGARPDDLVHLFAFREDGCGASTCAPAWSYEFGDLGVLAGPVISGDTLYVSSQYTPDPDLIGVLVALPAHGCGAPVCRPLWTGLGRSTGALSPPVVTGGVVLVGAGPASGFPVDVGVFAFPAAGCGARNCPAITLSQAAEDAFYLGAPLAVAGHRVYLTAKDNARGASYLYALGV